MSLFACAPAATPHSSTIEGLNGRICSVSSPTEWLLETVP